MRRSLETQRSLGYSAPVAETVYEGAVSEAAKAVDRLLRAQHRKAAA
jgi:hypothetical protein